MAMTEALRMGGAGATAATSEATGSDIGSDQAIIRQPVPWGPVLAATGSLLVLLVLVSNRYGYHRDELYFRMLPPAWGYTDQPLLTPLLARTTLLLADEPWALRLPAAVLAATSVVVITLVTRELGGGRLAQTLAAWGYAYATFTLNFGHMLMTASGDLVVWPLVVLFVLRALLRREPRWWLHAGLVVGLSTYNKWLVVLLVLSIVGGLLLVGPRKPLLGRPFLTATGLALLIALPNLFWQATHGWPQFDMGRALSAQNADVVRPLELPALLVMISPLLFPICVAGFVGVIRRPEWRPVRWLAPGMVIMVALTLVGGSQVHYPYGLLAVIFAAGCPPAADFARLARSRMVLISTAVVLHIVVGVTANLPVLPERVVADSFLPSLNTGLAEQIGWPTYVQQIDRVTARLRVNDPRVVVLASNYGEAGALARFRTQRNVLMVSGHNALGYLGGPPAGTRTVVVVGAQLSRAAGEFTTCETVDHLQSGFDIDNEEEGQPIAVCAGPKKPWETLWPVLRHLS
jgi:Dolichyl-phosphate-mannose-protein mannosyltransferase